MEKILVVDDDPNVLQTYESLLSRNKFKVVKSIDGQDALFKHRNEPFDLIITDLRMPKLSGESLIRALRSEGANMHCPIIVSSGFIGDADSKGIDPGHDIYFLPKPSRSSELIEMINTALHRRREAGSLDTAVINPIVMTLIEELASAGRLTIASSGVTLKQPADPGCEISVWAGVVSERFRGTLGICFKKEDFLRLTSRILNAPQDHVTDENGNEMKRLLDVTLDKAKRKLSESGIRILLQEASWKNENNHHIQHIPGEPVLRIQLSSPHFGECYFEICGSAMAARPRPRNHSLRTQ